MRWGFLICQKIWGRGGNCPQLLPLLLPFILHILLIFRVFRSRSDVKEARQYNFCPVLKNLSLKLQTFFLLKKYNIFYKNVPDFLDHFKIDIRLLAANYLLRYSLIFTAKRDRSIINSKVQCWRPIFCWFTYFIQVANLKLFC